MYNNELEQINTPEKAYLLGLFYADGNVSLNQTHCRLALQKSDKNLLQKLHIIFPFFTLYETKNLIVLGTGIKRIHEDLIKWGCYPQKSVQQKEKLHIPERLPQNLIWNFIRGYFDGNGSCTLTMGKTIVQKRLKFYSTSTTLIKDFCKILNNNNIKFTVTSTKHKDRTILLYSITISTISYFDLYKLMYNNELYLERKFKMFKNLLKQPIFIQAPLTLCSKCGNVKAVKNGSYSYNNIKKQRYLCRNCNHTFCP